MKKNAIAIACTAAIVLAFMMPLGLAGLLRPEAAVTNHVVAQNPDDVTSSQATVPEQQEAPVEEAADPAGDSPDEAEYVSGVVLARIADGVSVDEVNAQLEGADFIATKHIDESDIVYGYVSLELAAGVDVETALGKLSDSPFVAEAQPDYVYHALDEGAVGEADANVSEAAQGTTMQAATSSDLMAALTTTPSDEYLSQQWALKAIKAYEAWDQESARGNHKVTVAVLDSGLDEDHPDFKNADGTASNIIGGCTVLKGHETTGYNDTYGHGSHVAGIISAWTGNGKGVAGVSYNANLLPVRVMDDNGIVASSDAAKGVQYIVNYAANNPSANVKVINISFGTLKAATGTGDVAGDRQFAAALADAHAKDILVVYAAGNGASSSESSAYTCYPCDADPAGLGVINVQQSGSKYPRYSSSNFNAAADAASSTKQISAPGASIYSTTYTGGYGYKTGTSMAAPCVSGVAAMVFAANPSLKATDVKQILKDTATDLTPSNSGPETLAGFDRFTGYGMINAEAAVKAAANSGGGGSEIAGNLANAEVTLSASNYTYNGSAQKPTVTVMLGYTTLNAGTDYTVSYSSDCTNAGTKVATVRPGSNGSYTGSKAVSYTIGKRSASITATSASKVYDGTALTASAAGYTTSGFVKSSDYSGGVVLSGSITNVGSVKARVTFVPSATVAKNYNVTTRQGTLTVTAASLSSATVSPPSYAYDGKAKNPAVIVKGSNGKTLTNRVDYTLIVPAGRTTPGTYTYSITGKGNYAGSLTASFTISAKRKSIYRMYNPNNGDHHYTSGADERDWLVKLGWNYEGVAWYSPSVSSTPIYRMYNPYSGDHHYTPGADERDWLVKLGWNYEGIAWYSDDAKGVPLYRMFNPNVTIGTHHYTPGAAERDWLVKLGWRYEGIAWCGMK